MKQQSSLLLKRMVFNDCAGQKVLDLALLSTVCDSVYPRRFMRMGTNVFNSIVTVLLN